MQTSKTLMPKFKGILNYSIHDFEQDFIFKIVTLELDETGKFSKLVLADKEIEQLWLTATFDEQQQLQIKFRAHMGELIMCSFEEKELNRYIDIWKKLWRADSANNQILLDQFGLVTIMRLAAINHQVAKNFLTTLLESIPTPVNEWLANYFKYKKINNFSYMVKSIKSNLLSIDIIVQNKLKNIIKVIAYHPDLELTIVTPYINKFFPDENLPYEKKSIIHYQLCKISDSLKFSAKQPLSGNAEAINQILCNFSQEVINLYYLANGKAQYNYSNLEISTQIYLNKLTEQINSICDTENKKNEVIPIIMRHLKSSAQTELQLINYYNHIIAHAPIKEIYWIYIALNFKQAHDKLQTLPINPELLQILQASRNSPIFFHMINKAFTNNIDPSHLQFLNKKTKEILKKIIDVVLNEYEIKDIAWLYLSLALGDFSSDFNCQSNHISLVKKPRVISNNMQELIYYSYRTPTNKINIMQLLKNFYVENKIPDFPSLDLYLQYTLEKLIKCLDSNAQFYLYFALIFDHRIKDYLKINNELNIIKPNIRTSQHINNLLSKFSATPSLRYFATKIIEQQLAHCFPQSINKLNTLVENYLIKSIENLSENGKVWFYKLLSTSSTIDSFAYLGTQSIDFLDIDKNNISKIIMLLVAKPELIIFIQELLTKKLANNFIYQEVVANEAISYFIKLFSTERLAIDSLYNEDTANVFAKRILTFLKKSQAIPWLIEALNSYNIISQHLPQSLSQKKIALLKNIILICLKYPSIRLELVNYLSQSSKKIDYLPPYQEIELDNFNLNDEQALIILVALVANTSHAPQARFSLRSNKISENIILDFLKIPNYYKTQFSVEFSKNTVNNHALIRLAQNIALNSDFQHKIFFINYIYNQKLSEATWYAFYTWLWLDKQHPSKEIIQHEFNLNLNLHNFTEFDSGLFQCLVILASNDLSVAKYLTEKFNIDLNVAFRSPLFLYINLITKNKILFNKLLYGYTVLLEKTGHIEILNYFNTSKNLVINQNNFNSLHDFYLAIQFACIFAAQPKLPYFKINKFIITANNCNLPQSLIQSIHLVLNDINYPLTQLELNGINLTDKDINTLFTFNPSKLHELETLNLSNNLFTHLGINHLSKWLNFTKIKNLNISNCHATWQGGGAIAHIISTTSVKKLEIEQNKENATTLITNQNIDQITSAILTCNREIQLLDLSGCNLCKSNMRKLYNSLTNLKLVELTLGDLSLSNLCFDQLLNLLNENKTLVTININHVSANEKELLETLDKFIIFLKKQKIYKKLSLNPINPSGDYTQIVAAKLLEITLINFTHTSSPITSLVMNCALPSPSNNVVTSEAFLPLTEITQTHFIGHNAPNPKTPIKKQVYKR